MDAGSITSATPQKPPLKILLCSPRGFCAGVVRAIDAVERALAVHGAPVYVRHEIVHNRYVVDKLRAQGAHFVDDLEEVFLEPAFPEGVGRYLLRRVAGKLPSGPFTAFHSWREISDALFP